MGQLHTRTYLHNLIMGTWDHVTKPEWDQLVKEL